MKKKYLELKIALLLWLHILPKCNDVYIVYPRSKGKSIRIGKIDRTCLINRCTWHKRYRNNEFILLSFEPCDDYVDLRKGMIFSKKWLKNEQEVVR